MPMPVSDTVSTALSPQRPTPTVTLPPGTLYLMALSQRLYRISDSSRRAARTVTFSPVTVMVTFFASAAS